MLIVRLNTIISAFGEKQRQKKGFLAKQKVKQFKQETGKMKEKK